VAIALVAQPNTVSTCPGKITLNATVKDSSGALVPDGTIVNFTTNGGELSRPTALTTKGIASVVLNLAAPASPLVAAPIYTVAANTLQIVAFTNVQVACPYQPPVTATTPPSCGVNGAPACAGPSTPAVAPPLPPQAPVQAPPQAAANGRIRPPSTGDAGLGPAATRQPAR
jgi:hypothetical protein